jgi:hypothetical protein
MNSAVTNGFMRNVRTRLSTVALVSVLVYGLMALQPVKAKKFGDLDFHEEAKILAGYLHGTASYDELSITKAPGPVLYYWIPYFIAGPAASDQTYWLFGVIWTAVLTTLTLVVLYWVIDNRLGSKAASIFLALLFVVPLHAYYATGILAEGMAFLGVCWILIGLLQYDRTLRFYICFTLGTAALVLARPNAGLVIPFVFVFGLYTYWRRKDRLSLRPVVSSMAAFVIVAGISLYVRSLPNSRDTLKQDEYLSFVMHHGRFQFRTEPFDWRFWDNKTRPDSKDYQAWLASTDSLNRVAKNRSLSYSEIYYNWVISDLLEHPFMLGKQFVIRLLFGNTLQISSKSSWQFASTSVSGDILYWTFHIVVNLLNYAMLGLAIYYIYVQRWQMETWPLLAIVLSLWIFHGLVYMEQRYLFPLRPIMLFWSAMGLVSLTKRSNR